MRSLGSVCRQNQDTPLLMIRIGSPDEGELLKFHEIKNVESGDEIKSDSVLFRLGFTFFFTFWLTAAFSGQ